MAITEFKSNLHVPADIDFAVAVRGYTFVVMRQVIGLNQKISYRIQQVVDELFINAVRYGSKKGEFVTLTFELHDDIIEVGVEDSGTGPCKTTAKELQDNIELRRQHFEDLKKQDKVYQALTGRGLAEITLNWVDDMHITDSSNGGLKVIISKNITNEKV